MLNKDIIKASTPPSSEGVVCAGCAAVLPRICRDAIQRVSTENHIFRKSQCNKPIYRLFRRKTAVCGHCLGCQLYKGLWFA